MKRSIITDMKENRHFSILSPCGEDAEYKQMSETTCHDLGLDAFCREVTSDSREQILIMNILSNMTADPGTAVYRQKVFADMLSFPKLREQLTELFEKLEFIRGFSTNRMETDEKLGFWHLMHRLDELDDYIKCVEELRDCLSAFPITSEGLSGFRDYVCELYDEAYFAEMKKDIAALKERSSDIKSVTLGVNVNQRFEAVSMGLVSVNSKPFRKSGIVGNLADAVSSKDRIQKDSEWNGSMHYHQIERYRSHKITSAIEQAGSYIAVTKTPFVDGRIRSTVVQAPVGDGTANSTLYLDKVMNRMLDSLVKKLRDVLTKYADVAMVNISRIVPEFIYYTRLAEFISRRLGEGYTFCEASVIGDGDVSMRAKDLYNPKLADVAKAEEIVPNDLVFDSSHTIYILTGANRGGKTTLTQAIGLLFVLAQGGVFVPASSFEYKPVDCVYTHFPADEDKTLDLGRLGEECVRFRTIYSDCTENSLILLNETFSTTSFEEGFYIAEDSVKALIKKGAKTIYNTHMHKLAADTEKLNSEVPGKAKTASLVMRSENGNRLFRVETALPDGLSYAKDIAEKYGVTYEMLTE